jgi:hypothetical protein
MHRATTREEKNGKETFHRFWKELFALSSLLFAEAGFFKELGERNKRVERDERWELK